MPFNSRCTHCGNEHVFDDDAMGQAVRCSACGNEFTVADNPPIDWAPEADAAAESQADFKPLYQTYRLLSWVPLAATILACAYAIVGGWATIDFVGRGRGAAGLIQSVQTVFVVFICLAIAQLVRLLFDVAEDSRETRRAVTRMAARARQSETR